MNNKRPRAISTYGDINAEQIAEMNEYVYELNDE